MAYIEKNRKFMNITELLLNIFNDEINWIYIIMNNIIRLRLTIL